MSTPTRRKAPAGAAKAVEPVETDEFELGTWFNPETEKVEPRMVTVRKPDETDHFVLLKIKRILDQGQSRGDTELITDAIGAFGDVIDSMFVDPEDRRWTLDALISRTISPTEYGQLMVDIMKRWNITEEEAPTTGPRPTKRAAGARRR